MGATIDSLTLDPTPAGSATIELNSGLKAALSTLPVSTPQAAADAAVLASSAQRASNLSDLASAATARTNLGLGNVDNTSDADKPVSTATQAALDEKLDASEKGASGGVALADLSNPDAATALAARIPDEQLWVFPSFSSTQQKLQLLVSGDGINWRLFATDVYAAASLTFRDPSLLWHEGWWYIAHSNVASGTFVGNVMRIIRSRDLLNWTAYAGITITGQTYAWSPEWFVDTDGSVRIYFAASSTDLDGFAMYSISPTVAGDFTAWGEPVEVYDDVSCIDPSVVRSGATYYLFYKNETTDETEVASASSADGPFVRIGEVNASWAAEYEGASIHQMPDGTWRLYADKYTGPNQGYYYAESVALTSGWGAFTAITTNTGGLWTVRHGTPKRVTGDATRSALAAVALSTNLIRGLLTKGGGGGTDMGMVFTDPVLVSESNPASWAQRQLYHAGGAGTYKAMTEAVANDSWQLFRGLAAQAGDFLLDVTLGTRAARWYGGWRAASFTADQQALSGAGAVDIVTGTTLLTTTGANALTLANGTAGQRKTVVMVVDGGDGTLTPTTKTGFTTLTFTAVGQAVTLEYVTTLGWMIVSNNGATVA